MRLSIPSYAKINLHLAVLGKRDDGYHELLTVFQTVDLHDELTVELGGTGVSLEVVEGEAPAGRDNLMVRAAEAYLERWGRSGALLELRKRIPMGGGLGGGSSNAAATLVGLDRLHGGAAPQDELEEVARGLGADVPYFLVGGRALGRGRGDRVTELPDEAPVDLWLVTPPVHIATAEVFAALDELTPRSGVSSMEFVEGVTLTSGSGRPPGQNDLQEPVVRRYAPVGQVFDAILDAGGEWALLSGSGSTVFCPRPDSSVAAAIRARLPVETRVFECRTVPRRQLLRT